MANLIAFLQSHELVVILGALLAVSEALAAIPSLKSNSVLQLVMNVLGFIKDKLLPGVSPPAPPSA